MDKTKWNTIIIEVPEDMIYSTKGGKLKIGRPLTKTGNVSSKNKFKSIILKESNIDEPIISNFGEKTSIIKKPKPKRMTKKQKEEQQMKEQEIISKAKRILQEGKMKNVIQKKIASMRQTKKKDEAFSFLKDIGEKAKKKDEAFSFLKDIGEKAKKTRTKKQKKEETINTEDLISKLKVLVNMSLKNLKNRIEDDDFMIYLVDKYDEIFKKLFKIIKQYEKDNKSSIFIKKLIEINEDIEIEPLKILFESDEIKILIYDIIQNF